MEEEYKPVPEFEGLYEISNFGNIRRCQKTVSYVVHRQRGSRIQTSTFQVMPLRMQVNSTGDTYVQLRKDNKSYGRCVHLLVAKVFVPNPENKKCVLHLDNNKSNNRADNLVWVNSRKELQKLQETL